MSKTGKTVDIYLLPGDYFVGDSQHRVRTVVGSCVAITLWHPGQRVGGMAHFLLPGFQRKRSGAMSGTYGTDAVRLLVAGMRRLRAPLHECEAKVFGGGAMFGELMAKSDVGRQNGDCAMQLLQEHGIRIVAENLYGEGHRQLIFSLHSGDVLCRQVAPEQPAPGALPGRPRPQVVV